MSTSKNRRQTPAQRAAQRRIVPARQAATAPAQAAPATAPQATAASGPSGEPEIFDLDAVAHEASGERFRFKVQGQIFELFTPEEVDWRENSALTERATGIEDMRPILRLLLGPDQYERFLDLTISSAQASELIVQWSVWHGFELPE